MLCLLHLDHDEARPYCPGGWPFPCTPRLPQALLTKAPRAGVEFADHINPVPELVVRLAGDGAFFVIDLVNGTIPIATAGALKPAAPPRGGGGVRKPAAGP